MLTITKPEPNRVDIDLSGKIDSDEMAKLLMSFHKLTTEQQLKVLEFINAQKAID